MKQKVYIKQGISLLTALVFSISLFSNNFFTAGGVIFDDQVVCFGQMPNLIQESTPPTIPGPYEYLWRQLDPNDNAAQWADIPGSNTISFAPPAASVPTLYTRLVRTAGTTDNFVGSNPVLVDVSDLPTANITGAPTNATVYIPVFVNAANSTNDSTFEWDFGDGYTCIGQSCSHVYEPNGNANTTYTICLTVTTSNNCVESTCQQIQVVDPVLPVEMLYFEGYEDQQHNINLKWATAIELNNSHFIIEWSEDGNYFEEIGRVEGQGNAIDVQYYSFMDENPLNGNNYYRLKQVDFDGKHEYFEIITVSSNAINGEVSIYPNPASEKITISINDKVIVNPEMRIYDATGKLVISDNLTSERLSNLKLEMDVNFLESGLYYINIINNGELLHSQKLSIIH